MSKFVEKTISQETIFEGKIISVHKDTVLLPNGKTATREVVRHPGAVAIVAMLEGKILLVSQYRYVIGKETLEIPAGKIDSGEEPLVCAQRELREETGYKGELEYLGVFNTSPGFADEAIYLYFAKNLIWSPLDADEDEFLGVSEIPWNEAVDMVKNKQIQDAKTALGILLADKLYGDVL